MSLADPASELDILTVAMQSGAFSDEDLVDQMMTFLAAGTLPPSILDTWRWPADRTH